MSNWKCATSGDPFYYNSGDNEEVFFVDNFFGDHLVVKGPPTMQFHREHCHKLVPLQRDGIDMRQLLGKRCAILEGPYKKQIGTIEKIDTESLDFRPQFKICWENDPETDEPAQDCFWRSFGEFALLPNEFQHIEHTIGEWANKAREMGKEPYLTDEKQLVNIGSMLGLNPIDGETVDSFYQRLVDDVTGKPLHTSPWANYFATPNKILEDIKKAYGIISSSAKHPGPQIGVQEFKVDFKFSIDDEVDPTPCPNPGLEGIWLYRDEDETTAVRVTWDGLNEEWEAVSVKEPDDSYVFVPGEYDFGLYWIEQLEPATPGAAPYKPKRLPDHWDPLGLG